MLVDRSTGFALPCGSIQCLEKLYNSCTSIEAKRMLMEPILRNMGNEADCTGRKDMWSRSVFEAFSSTNEARMAKRRSHVDIQKEFGDSLCDPATLLYFLYTEASQDAALSMAMDKVGEECRENRRSVSIDCPAKYEGCFEKPTEHSFYTLRVHSDNPWALPTITFSTSCGNMHSDMLAIYTLEGTQMVEDVCHALESSNTTDYILLAKKVATEINSRCDVNTNNGKRQVILASGLNVAMEKAAKSAGFRVETAILCDMVIASLMIDHEKVVLQSFRKNMTEITMILRQFALACYHYQLLPNELSSPCAALFSNVKTA